MIYYWSSKARVLQLQHVDINDAYAGAVFIVHVHYHHDFISLTTRFTHVHRFANFLDWLWLNKRLHLLRSGARIDFECKRVTNAKKKKGLGRKEWQRAAEK